MQQYLQHIACDRRPVLAGDHTAWPFPMVCTLRDRTIEHPLDPVPGGPPITLLRPNLRLFGPLLACQGWGR